MSDDSKQQPSPPRTHTVTATSRIGVEARAFDEFVKRQQTTKSEEPPVDWAKERDEWLAFLNALYSRIESFLATYLSSGEIQCEYHDVELNEENIGSYIARRMVLKIVGRHEVTFTPIGTLLIGFKGRVDVLGPAGSARIVLVNKRATGARSLIQVTVRLGGTPPPAPSAPAEPIEWDWKIVSPPPEMSLIDLTSEVFFAMILAVTNA